MELWIVLICFFIIFNFSKFSTANLMLYNHKNCSWGSQNKNTEVVHYSFLQWTMFCQNSPPWPICLESCMAWLIASLSSTWLWSIWSFWLAFCDCGFHSGDCGIIVLLLLSVLWWMRIRGLCKLPDGTNWLWVKLSLALVGRVMLSKSLIQIQFVLLGKKKRWRRFREHFPEEHSNIQLYYLFSLLRCAHS